MLVTISGRLLEFGQPKQHFICTTSFFGFAPENRVNLVRNGLLKCPQKSTQLSLSALSSELSLTLLSQLWLLLLLCSWAVLLASEAAEAEQKLSLLVSTAATVYPQLTAFETQKPAEIVWYWELGKHRTYATYIFEYLASYGTRIRDGQLK